MAGGGGLGGGRSELGGGIGRRRHRIGRRGVELGGARSEMGGGASSGEARGANGEVGGRVGRRADGAGRRRGRGGGSSWEAGRLNWEAGGRIGWQLRQPWPPKTITRCRHEPARQFAPWPAPSRSATMTSPMPQEVMISRLYPGWPTLVILHGLSYGMGQNSCSIVLTHTRPRPCEAPTELEDSPDAAGSAEAGSASCYPVLDCDVLRLS